MDDFSAFPRFSSIVHRSFIFEGRCFALFLLFLKKRLRFSRPTGESARETMKNYSPSKSFSSLLKSRVISEDEKYENLLNFGYYIINSPHRISIETAAITKKRSVRRWVGCDTAQIIPRLSFGMILAFCSV
jgi:hypothetical protein